MSDKNTKEMSSSSLDPANPEEWQAFRQQAHGMLDDMLGYLQDIRSRPVWQPIPDAIRAGFHEPLPRAPGDLAQAHRTFMDNILPYAVGNAHPGFMGWVHGGGSPVGMLAEMLAAGLNANLGGRDHIPIEVERQIVRWVRELFGFPETASGLFVTGSSMANFIGTLVARTRKLGADVRTDGVAASAQRLSAYTSARAHGCIAQAMDLAGLGRDMLRLIPVNEYGQMDLSVLAAQLKVDSERGFTPFLIVGTAGTVDAGAIDDLTAIAQIARQHDAYFHVDGAFGALAMLSPQLAPRLKGLELADSVAFDFHKWMQVPYDAGFILVRDGELHLETFASQEKTYLKRGERGMAAGSPWPCDYGPDLSRGFRALKTWFTLKVYGADGLARVIEHSCALAQYLQQKITANPQLQLLAPVALNIVCFRYLPEGISDEQADALNQQIVIALQESGIVAPSSTTMGGHFAIRAALFNHRTSTQDIDALLDATLTFGRRLAAA
ncbi:pyridoxal phosphate-dependent decarboxylase family protein [Undibacterium terreum]|uniref:Cytochrome d ubiquinol oxidase subunit I n=1 Tax=Undibacterium terreum TaxID=1224302 RepID=A0A916U6X1_9BURK|nr:aminotransferase class V-fold PLP-dependent enzyme [Undibacterium terreum]GGC62064.1 cytochrome d ubiquinol oxidase subunit I [Undibacterium terreum]